MKISDSSSSSLRLFNFQFCWFDFFVKYSPWTQALRLINGSQIFEPWYSRKQFLESRHWLKVIRGELGRMILLNSCWTHWISVKVVTRNTHTHTHFSSHKKNISPHIFPIPCLYEWYMGYYYLSISSQRSRGLTCLDLTTTDFFFLNLQSWTLLQSLIWAHLSRTSLTKKTYKNPDGKINFPSFCPKP